MPESIIQLVRLMRSHGAKRFYAKRLAPNDNSKNQVYLGGDFSVLHLIPHGDIYTDQTTIAGSIRDRSKANLAFFWVDEQGKYNAPNTQLILYPKYPEVRMSGFLKGCRCAPSSLMACRDLGRVLFLGVSDDEIFGYVVSSNHALVKQLDSHEWETDGVFLKIPAFAEEKESTKTQLLQALFKVHEKGWIRSQKMNADGSISPYQARNGGGYTLEAELGISPNGHAEPDYMGWEVKQYGVKDFKFFQALSPVTLMTPEPTGGIYRDLGVTAFISRFGYPDKSGKPDRFNFGGIYACGKDYNTNTGLKLVIDGYDPKTNKITKVDGVIALVSARDEVAASWDFNSITTHWSRKHSQAGYVPSINRQVPPDFFLEYAYGYHFLLCEKTSVFLLLKAIAMGLVYYDPAIKIENMSTRPVSKRRSQFRIKYENLTSLYSYHSIVSANEG